MNKTREEQQQLQAANEVLQGFVDMAIAACQTKYAKRKTPHLAALEDADWQVRVGALLIIEKLANEGRTTRNAVHFLQRCLKKEQHPVIREGIIQVIRLLREKFPVVRNGTQESANE